jgi:hypothetical protein
MGGKKSDFTYVGFNEPAGGPQISYQHDVRMLGGGLASVWDNGNQYKPALTKAKFIKIDENNKTVTLLREYAHPNKLYTSNQGNVQALPNGNAMLSWGSANNTQTIAFNEIDGEQVKSSDVKLVMFNNDDTVPSLSDKVVMNGVTYDLINVNPVQAGSKVIIFMLQLRR